MIEDIVKSDLKTILHSKRANLYYLEKCRIMQKDGRIVYLTETKKENLFWNIPIANTTVILLGSGTSVTQAAMRLLSGAGVLVGFCGGGATPLFAGTEVEWQHPDKGLLAPGVFIDVLEKTGFVYRLDRYMWDKAVKQLAEWKKRGINDYHISVNISTKDFYLIDVYETFVGLVEKYDIDPKLLKLEITETALMSDFNKNMVIIKRLQKYGFDIEIDDFGSGYSSLNMLKDISADVLKIDMGFLRASENEVKGQDILESIIGLANKLGMRVITEGVEKKTQVDMLYDMGCKMFQGYYFSKPIPVDEFEKKYNIG